MGARTGEGTEYDECGEVKFSGHFENGIYDGEGALYVSGCLLYRGEFQNGRRTGQGKEYDPEGHLIYEGGFLNGLYDGTGTLYDRKTGVLIFSGNFRDGKALEAPKEPSVPAISEPEKTDEAPDTQLPDSELNEKKEVK